MRVLFDKNVPVGVRRFLAQYTVSTIVEMGWPERLENGELLRAAEASGFDVMVTSDQNIPYQQNLKGRKLSMIVLGSNTWPIVSEHAREIAEAVAEATPGSYRFIVMPLRPKTRRKSAE